MPVEFPVAPQLDAKGRLLSLAQLLGDAAKPVPLHGRERSYDLNMEGRTESASVLAQLGVASVFESKASFNSKIAVWDAQIGFWSVLDEPGPADVIYETFWGFGIRVHIVFHALEINANVSIPTVAATAEFKGAKVQYRITAAGLGPVELAATLRELPPVGRFDMTAYAKLVIMRNHLRAAMLERIKQLANDESALQQTLQPTLIRMAASPFPEFLDEAAAYRFTMQSIEAGQDLRSTLHRLDSTAGGHWNRTFVERIFRQEIGHEVGPTVRPSDEQRARAREWLRT